MIGPQLDELVGAYPNYNEEEEERRYYRRKRLGVVKNVLAASTGVTLTYGVYLGREDTLTLLALCFPSPSTPELGKRNLAASWPPSPFTSRVTSAVAVACTWDWEAGCATSQCAPNPARDSVREAGNGSLVLILVLMNTGKGRLGDSAPCQPCRELV